MTISPKRTAANKLLAAAGLLRPSNADAVAGFLWRFGIDMPPPFFRGFWGNLAFRGITSALIMGMGMWVFVWSRHGYSPSAALATTGILGLLYGLVTAGIYERLRRLHGLPLWRDIDPTSQTNVSRQAPATKTRPPVSKVGNRGPKPRTKN